MFRFETSVVIDRPIDEVWAFCTDPFNIPRLASAWLGLRKTSPGPLGLGSILQGRMSIVGFEARITGTLTEWDPPHAFTLSCVGAGFRSLVLRSLFEATPEGTRFVRISEGEPGPVRRAYWAVIGPIVMPLVRRRANATSQRLKRVLEAGRG